MGIGARIIAVANQKGGVGKTTTAMNLAAALVETGGRVLLIDSDPQANLTSYLGVTPGEAPFEGVKTLDELYLAKRPPRESEAGEWIAKVERSLHLIPSEKNLSGVEYYLLSRSDRETILSRFLKAVSPEYDVILIDTPPSVNVLTLNALVAADRVLIPVQAEFFSLEGIAKLRETVEEVKARWNPELSFVGILPSQVSTRRRLSEEVIGAIREEFGELVFATYIRDSVAVAESSGHGRSVLSYDGSGHAAREYRALAEEVIQRLDLRFVRVLKEKEVTV